MPIKTRPNYRRQGPRGTYRMHMDYVRAMNNLLRGRNFPKSGFWKNMHR